MPHDLRRPTRMWSRALALILPFLLAAAVPVAAVELRMPSALRLPLALVAAGAAIAVAHRLVRPRRRWLIGIAVPGALLPLAMLFAGPAAILQLRGEDKFAFIDDRTSEQRWYGTVYDFQIHLVEAPYTPYHMQTVIDLGRPSGRNWIAVVRDPRGTVDPVPVAEGGLGSMYEVAAAALMATAIVAGLIGASHRRHEIT